MQRIVPTSVLESGGSSREIVAIADVGWTSAESADDPVKTRTLTSDPEARAAPTITYQNWRSVKKRSRLTI
jgi:hypothetical protein